MTPKRPKPPWHKHSGAAQRRRRKLRAWMLRRYGDGTTVPCAGCQKTLTNETLTIDRYPKPGRDGGEYTKPNIRPMCEPCNTSGKYDL